jgi:hypothetical protein
VKATEIDLDGDDFAAKEHRKESDHSDRIADRAQDLYASLCEIIAGRLDRCNLRAAIDHAEAIIYEIDHDAP